jgi:hypothetical protein
MIDKDCQAESKIGEQFEMILLRPWQEIVGVLEVAFLEEPFFTVQLGTGGRSVRLAFEADSSETDQILDVLADYPIGVKVGIIMTDSNTKPFSIREFRK